MKLKDIIIKLDKSNIKAGSGKEYGKYPLYTCSQLINKFLDDYQVDEEAIVISTGGLFSIHYVNGKFNYSTDCFVFKTKRFKAKYIYYYLLSKSNYINNMFRGAGLKHLNKNELLALEIEEKNIKEQEEIISKLDMIINAIENRKEQIIDLNKIIESQFITMFGDPILNEKHWVTAKLNDVAPTKHYKGEHDDKVWLLNLDMVESNTGKIIDYIYESKEKIVSSTCSFDETNVLYSKLRPYLNKVVVPDRKGFATSEMIPLSPKENKLDRVFFGYLLRGKSFVNYISEKVSGAKMPRVIMEEFKNIDVILPPMEKQKIFSEFTIRINLKEKNCYNDIVDLEKLLEIKMYEYFS